jgi:GDPmannose 4,6-dehydratase
VRQFIEMSAKQLGIEIRWEGEGVEEKGYVASIEGDKATGLSIGQTIVAIDVRYFRPAEVETLLGDPTKAKEKLGWVPQITVQEMISEMVDFDLDEARKHALLKDQGYNVSVSRE